MTPTKIPQTIIKEAEELYKLIGLDPNIEPKTEEGDFLKFLPSYTNTEEVQHNGTEEKLHWTRLSINSNFGCIAD